MKFYIIAGEKSGDMHAANLVNALLKTYPNAKFRGFGGDLMLEQGVELCKHISQTAFMGFVEVVKNLGKIRRNFRDCEKDLLEFAPDVVILVDYPGFNLRMAKFAKKHGLKVIYYISPKIWAWNTGRVHNIKKYVDLMLCILPFELDFYKKFDYEVKYVGNPLLDSISAFEADKDFLEKNHLGTKKIIALLPGSRKQELLHNLPVMAKAVKPLLGEYQIVVAGLKALPEKLYLPAKEAGLTFVWDETYNLLSHAEAAVVVSGTATLETAIFNVPQVVIYRMTFLTALIASIVIKIPFISLVNLVANAEAVKELIQFNCTPKAIFDEIKGLVVGERRAEVLASYQKLHHILGEKGASNHAAKAIEKFLAQ